MERKEAASHMYNLATGVVGIVLYEYYDLFVSTISLIAMTGTKLLYLRATSKADEKMHWTEKLDWFGFAILLAFGLPAILLENGFLAKIQGPVSSFICGLGILGANYFKNIQVFKQIFAPPLASQGIALPDNSWKKIDYWYAGEFILSSIASTAMVLLLPTDIWMYAKYATTCTSFIPLIAMFRIMSRDCLSDISAQPILEPQRQPSPRPQPSPTLQPSPPLQPPISVSVSDALLLSRQGLPDKRQDRLLRGEKFTICPVQ